MGIICNRCGKQIEGEGVAFCPYCGQKLTAEAAPVQRPEEEKWIREARAAISYPERKKILLEGLKACPDSREISWELLFVGEEAPKKGWGIDFSIIQSWVLEIYRDPKAFSEAKRDQMRSQLFDSPKLTGNDRRIAAIRAAGCRCGGIADDLRPAGRTLIQFHAFVFGIPCFIRSIVCIKMSCSGGFRLRLHGFKRSLFRLLKILLIIVLNAFRCMRLPAVIALQHSAGAVIAQRCHTIRTLIICNL